MHYGRGGADVHWGNECGGGVGGGGYWGKIFEILIGFQGSFLQFYYFETSLTLKHIYNSSNRKHGNILHNP